MTVIGKPTTTIPVTMCGARKNSSHGSVMFNPDEIVVKSQSHEKENSKEIVAA